MAVSGLMLLGFVIVHLAGNLQLYAGAEVYNGYSAKLHAMPELLWLGRIVLLGALAVHVVSAVQLAQRNRAARPRPYHFRKYIATSYAARTMYFSGPIIFLFVAYHLAHLTFGFTPGYTFDPHNVYNNVVLGFQRVPVSLIYIAANLALGMHLYHGIWSMLQSIGASHPRYDHLRTKLATGLAAAITIGNVSMPLAVMFGAITPVAV